MAAVAAGSVIGLIGGAVGLILGTLRMPALLGRIGLPAATLLGARLTGRMSEGTLKRAIGAALVAVGLAIAAEAVL